MLAFEISSGCNRTGKMEHKHILLGDKRILETKLPGDAVVGPHSEGWYSWRQGSGESAANTHCPDQR